MKILFLSALMCCVAQPAWAAAIAEPPAQPFTLILWLIGIFTLIHAKAQKHHATKNCQPYLVKGVSGWLLFFILTSTFNFLLSLLAALGGVLSHQEMAPQRMPLELSGKNGRLPLDKKLLVFSQ